MIARLACYFKPSHCLTEKERQTVSLAHLENVLGALSWTTFSPFLKTKGHEALLLLTIHTPLPRIAFVLLGINKKKETGAQFLQAVLSFYPYKINYILTDNGWLLFRLYYGPEFTYCAPPKHSHTNKVHPCDQICCKHKISHRTINFRHPWTNGMVERFNRTIRNQVLDKYLFSSIFEMNGQLAEFVNR